MPEDKRDPTTATTSHQLDFYDHDHEVQFSITLTGVTEEKAVDTAKGIYFASDENISHWNLEVKKNEQ